MKAKLTGNYDPKYVKGYEVEIDKIEIKDGYGSRIRVRITNMTKKPIWLDWGWVNEEAMNGMFKYWVEQ